MIIMSTVSYLPEYFKDAYQKFKEMPSPPPFVTLKGPYMKCEAGTGIKGYAFYEFEPSKMKEALDFVVIRMGKFVGIPGYTYSIDVLTDATDAALRPFGEI